MEDNKTPDIPLPCTAGCGFYGNKIYNNMCSKCFKDFTERQKANDNKTEVETESSNNTETPSTKESIETILSAKEPTNKKEDEIKDITPSLDTITTTHTTVTENIETTSDTISSTHTDTIKVEESIPIEKPKEDKPIQKNKGRCFTCKTKIPLTKQLTNKCRCEFIFCDSHRYPDKHECQFDHAAKDKDILAKNNPKLNDKPRGGRSIQRLDSF
ncbi:unnamed protein product [Cunninghamella blakesleeana]